MTALTENPTYIEKFEEKAQMHYQQISRSQELGEPPARIIQWRKGPCTPDSSTQWRSLQVLNSCLELREEPKDDQYILSS